MEYFNDIVQYVPSNWEHESYHNKTYILVDLDSESEEYEEILQYCNTNNIHNVKEIKRIQHPFAYLRSQLKLEFDKKWGGAISVMTRSHTAVCESHVDVYIKHNCDKRRCECSYYSKKSNYVIQKKMNVYPERDTNWYPEYLVKIE